MRVKEGLKIGYLIPQFPGQTHIFFWRELRELEKLGVDVSVFSTRMPPPGLISHDWSLEAIERTYYLGRPRLGDLLGCLGALPYGEVFHALKRDGGRLLKDILICAPAARRLIGECRVRGITHVHAHSCGRAALITALARLMGGPTYSLTLHGPMSDYGDGQPLKWRHASYATIITRKLLAEAQDFLGTDLPERVLIQPMGVDTDVLSREDAYSPPLADKPVRLFSCARLNVVKGHQDLMRAIRVLVDRGIDAQLEIAGEDDDGGQGFRRVLADEITKLGLSDRVTLLGAIDGGAVRKKLLEAHVFVLASWHEPLGVAYMEAMACEVPTIGTDAGGVGELITQHVDGILVEPKNPEALAGAIQDLINNPEKALALSTAGRERIVGNFSSKRGAEVLLRESSKS
ncbi:MAG: glycosyltransferase family 4 protein [Rhodobacteraceae bacterium]|nr:glycosyltransferase family 4 protein [Paracoccaceae bacterium]